MQSEQYIIKSAIAREQYYLQTSFDYFLWIFTEEDPTKAMSKMYEYFHAPIFNSMIMAIPSYSDINKVGKYVKKFFISKDIDLNETTFPLLQIDTSLSN